MQGVDLGANPLHCTETPDSHYMINEIYTPGIGMYRQDQRDNYSVIDPDEYETESLQSEDWWHENMQRITLPGQARVLPELEEESPSAIIFFMLKLFWLLFLSSYESFWKKIKGVFEFLAEHILPESQALKRDKWLQKEHIQSIRRKWKTVDPLPTFGAQDHSLAMLQEIGHDTSEDKEGYLQPDEAGVKTMVKLMLDRRNRPHVTCVLEDCVPATFLVDSGACLSILSYDTYLKIPNHESLPKTYTTPPLYDHQQNRIPVKFGIKCRANFNDKTLVLSLLVSPGNNSNILGMNVLMGRSLVFTITGSDAYLLIGETRMDKNKLVMTLPNDMPMYILEDYVIPSESIRTITVTPCVFPMYVDIPDQYIRLTYIDPIEGFQGKTTHAKLDEQGRAKLRVQNSTLIDLHLPANQVIATGRFDPDYMPLRRVKQKKVDQGKAKDKPETKPLTEESSKQLKEEDKAKNIKEATLDSNGKVPDPPGEVNVENGAENLTSNSATENNSKDLGQIETVEVDPHGKEEPSKTISQTREGADTEPCFCKLSESNVVIRGNKFGDTNCPFLNSNLYSRSLLISGKSEIMKKGNKNILVLFSLTKRDFQSAVTDFAKNCPTAFISNNDELLDCENVRNVQLTGDCPSHRFPYHLRPTFISFSKTFQERHLKILHDFRESCSFDVLNVKVQAFWDDNIPTQLHFIVHIPEILTMKEHWIHNVIACLVKPFAQSVRILEPYLLGDDRNWRNMLFFGVLDKVAKLHKIILQGRDPSKEKFYELSPYSIHGCSCQYCSKEHQRKMYENMQGGMMQNEVKADLR